MIKFLTALVVLVILLPACTHENIDPRDTTETEPPANYPKKIVEVDSKDDSTVTTLAYNNSGNITYVVINKYENGQKTYLTEIVGTYNSNRALTYLVTRYKNLVTNEVGRVDKLPRISENRIIGYRVKDSAKTEVLYHRYVYDSNGGYFRHFGNVDSIDFFSPIINHYKYVDSAAFNIDGELKGYYVLSKNQITGGHDLLSSQTMENNAFPRDNFIHANINTYIIFDVPCTVGGVNPSTIKGKDFLSNKEEFVTCVTTYDSEFRPAKMEFSSTSNSGIVQNSLYGSYVKTRFLYY